MSARALGSRSGNERYAAVLFDFGGVILSSPFAAFETYERDAGLDRGFLRRLNSVNPDSNAWACMERGELTEAEFHARLGDEARALGQAVDARALMASLAGRVLPEMVSIVRNVGRRYRTACLTNNMRIGLGPAMASHPALAAEVADVMALFGHVVESSRIGARKPEPRFFARACEIIGVLPEQCIFLDDLGINLKPARAMGMTTIKVIDPSRAIFDLESALGHPVRGA